LHCFLLGGSRTSATRGCFPIERLLDRMQREDDPLIAAENGSMQCKIARIPGLSSRPYVPARLMDMA
jgi:hypothetical protein